LKSSDTPSVSDAGQKSDKKVPDWWLTSHAASHAYETPLDAFMAVIRFGPEFLSNAEFLMLLFHSERTLAFGKFRDCASISQMVSGVCAKKSNRWLRGNVGLKESGARKGNKGLADKGLLKSRKRVRESGADSPPEFEIQWDQVRQFFNKKAAAKPIIANKPGRPKTRVHQENPGFENETRVHHVKGEGSRSEGGRVHVVKGGGFT
jgi:hypothetical protein